jgi:VIT1/CCC1 family predicted Fe2+/Mn2+ transporter
LILGNAQYLIALAIMMLIVIAIIAVFTYYITVAQDGNFKNRFLEMALISVGVAILSFVVGTLAKSFLGVDV